MKEVLPTLPPGCRILEFGSGTGQQARFLADEGFDVVAIDLATSNYAQNRIFPVQDYDGHHIPLEDHSVDVIFSSNVLEHVENFSEISKEFRRVLRPGGFAVHVLPTAAWRFWSFFTYAAESIQAAGELPACLVRLPRANDKKATLIRHLRRIASGFVPRGHGTAIEGFSELWTFSRPAWRRKFRRSGFEVIQEKSTNLFYTGAMIFGASVSPERRRELSRLLGSACYMYVVRPVEMHK